MRPEDYDVIATLNLNGDYISDALAAQVGGIGIAPGGNIGDAVGRFRSHARHRARLRRQGPRQSRFADPVRRDDAALHRLEGGRRPDRQGRGEDDRERRADLRPRASARSDPPADAPGAPARGARKSSSSSSRCSRARRWSAPAVSATRSSATWTTCRSAPRRAIVSISPAGAGSNVRGTTITKLTYDLNAVPVRASPRSSTPSPSATRTTTAGRWRRSATRGRDS